MIPHQPFSPRYERISAYLVRNILEQTQVEPSRVREVALAVERFLEADISLGSLLSEDVLLWMVARALVAAGEDRIAERWIEPVCNGEAGRLALRCLREDERGDLWRLLGSGVLRWAACSFETEPIWVLDLGRISIRGGHFYELSWVPAVQQLVQRVIALWNRTGSRGAIALRGARALAQALYTRPSETRRSAKRIEVVCRETAFRGARESSRVGYLRVISWDAHALSRRDGYTRRCSSGRTAATLS